MAEDEKRKKQMEAVQQRSIAEQAKARQEEMRKRAGLSSK